VRNFPHRLASFSAATEAQRSEAKQYLNRALYQSSTLVRDQTEAAGVVRSLFEHWTAHPGELPASHQALLEEEIPARIVADYIAGMTDGFILEQHALHLGT